MTAQIAQFEKHYEHKTHKHISYFIKIQNVSPFWCRLTQFDLGKAIKTSV